MSLNELDEYLDLQTFLTRYKQFNESQMRWFVVKSKDNVLAPAIKRLGREAIFSCANFYKMGRGAEYVKD